MTFNDGVLILIRTSGGISPHRLAKDIIWSWQGQGEVTEQHVSNAIDALVKDKKIWFDGRWLRAVGGKK